MIKGVNLLDVEDLRYSNGLIEKYVQKVKPLIKPLLPINSRMTGKEILKF